MRKSKRGGRKSKREREEIASAKEEKKKKYLKKGRDCERGKEEGNAKVKQRTKRRKGRHTKEISASTAGTAAQEAREERKRSKWKKKAGVRVRKRPGQRECRGARHWAGEVSLLVADSHL